MVRAGVHGGRHKTPHSEGEAVFAFAVHGVGLAVTDIGATVAKLAKEGVKFERYKEMPQDDAGIWTAPDGAKVCWFKDPDGNTLSLTQFPSK